MKRNVRYTEHMSDLQIFVANVNAEIQAQGMSVSEVARRANIDRAELSRLLNGQGDATITRAAKIAKAVGVQLDLLLAAPIEASFS